MKKTFISIPKRVLALTFLMILGLGSFSVFSQTPKDILLYSTSFSDWDAMDNTAGGSATIYSATQSGIANGFTLLGKPGIFPGSTTTIGGAATGETGYVTFNNSTASLTFPSMSFISGGAIEVVAYIEKNASLSLTGVTVTSSSTIDAQPAAPLPISTISTGTVTLGKNYGVQKFTFVFSSAGPQTLVLNTTGKEQVSFLSLKVYSTVSAPTIYVASTNYPQAPADGLSISGTVGGPVVSGTVNVKAWNITGTVNMEIVGTDAAKFILPITTLTTVQAKAGQNITINFTPSVRAGVSNAQLKLTCPSDPTANTFYMNITGITSSGVAPQITTPATPIAFWTSPIAKATNTVNISGVNLTGIVTLSFTGPNASNFSVLSTTVSIADALSGLPVVITYTGNIVPGSQSANLVISSPGTSVTIPLQATTLDSRPVMRPLTFLVSPGGSGYVDVNPAGTSFLDGTSVNVTATPETGYKFDHWSDGKASNYTNRSITVIDKTPNPITAFFVIGTPPPPIPVGTAFVGYEPTNKTDISFTASWPSVALATGYVVTIYNADGTVKTTIPIASGSTTSTPVTGLSAGTYYSYDVSTTGLTPNQTTAKAGPYKTTGTSSIFTCGQP